MSEKFVLLDQVELCHAPDLALPDFSKLFKVDCDESATGVGAVVWRPIEFMSEKIGEDRRRWTTYKLRVLSCF